MTFRQALYLIIISSLPTLVYGQTETYTINKAPLSSDKYDEFSPVYYKSGLVFCTNRNTGLSNYSTNEEKGLFKINYIDTAGRVKWKNARLLSKRLTSKLNDGPSTFNLGGDTIIYSRNLKIEGSERDISSPRNKLGLFMAKLVDDNWTKITDFRFNNEWYNITTPCLSPDGGKLYYASDKSGGFGGFDIYYSQWKGDYWADPVNLGPVINTEGDEAYPFINPSGELFFSSDGHPGFGGKDIFFSRHADTSWLAPVRLDPPINSQYDDFSIITDSLISSGYFSSNREKSIDIYQFRTNFPQIFYTTLQKDNQYCFRFSDSGSIAIDNLNLEYIWSFGDGKKASGAVINYCFPGPGNYDVKLDLVDKATGHLFFSKLSYNLELKDFEQPYINAPEFAVIGDSIDFDGLKSYLPDYKILDYTWNFGDGIRLQGAKVKHSFKDKGEFMVNMGLTLRSEITGNIHNTGVTKKIYILNSNEEAGSYIINKGNQSMIFPNIKKYSNAYFENLYSAESEILKDAVFQVELLSSETKLGVNNKIFAKVPEKYFIKEIYNKDNDTYSYIIDQQINLMSTYFAYREISAFGFKEAHTRIVELKDPAEKELNTLMKIFGVKTDSYFDKNNRLSSSAYLLLDQIVKILNKYPETKLEIGVHTDNQGSSASMLILSQRYAQELTKYMISKGISINRLDGKGYGNSRPVAPNSSETGRSLNRRVDFTIIQN